MDPQLTDRQNRILSIIVDAYVETAEPVGSRAIAKKIQLELSPATIRNEMSDLEEAGLITHPHTSAGRIPTDLGYRYFIDHLLQRQALSVRLAADVAKEFQKEIESVEDLIANATRILATMTSETGIVSFPEIKELALAGVGLRRLDDHRVLVVWLTTTGVVHNQVAEMSGEIPDDTLKKIANFFNEELKGLPMRSLAETIRSKLEEKKDSLAAMYRKSLEIVEETLKKLDSVRFCLDGSSHILDKPEFQDMTKIRHFFRAIEDKGRLLGLLRDGLPEEGVQIHIGRENKWQDILDCSLVAASYKFRGKTVGTLGILGPSRMRYANAIALVDYISKELGQLLERWY
ncbi:MAG: heat-inducible transcription repressor HrcA [Candidatus Omnitrophica bacterium]|nr:heat-inducible transcription repressor HrcA [Candidatus Omnitrophota bacterium]